MKSLTFSCLICALNLHFAQIEVAHDQKGKICSRLLEPQKVAQKLPSTIGKGHAWEADPNRTPAPSLVVRLHSRF